jgi:hypothetical protein
MDGTATTPAGRPTHGTRASSTSGFRRDADPAAALDAVAEFLDRFVAWPSDHARVSAALWVAHTYLIESFDSTPRLAFLSPEPGSGKTRALEVIGSLVRHPMHAINCTPAALFRSVADLDRRPTILFDEIDTIFGPRAKDNEEVRGFLNAGHRRSGVAYRCVGLGTSQRVVAFPAFAAVALAGLHDVPETIASRAIVVRMRRRAPDEQVEPYRLRIHEPQGLAIGERLAEALDVINPIDEPLLPDGVVDRPADVWEPLLGIAESVSPEWATRARAACAHFVTVAPTLDPSLAVTLLRDLRILFGDTGQPDAQPTTVLLDGLHALDESPWRDLRGKPLDAAGLARRLKGFGIRSANIRVGSLVVKGYKQADLRDAWIRYLPHAISGNAATAATTPSPPPNNTGMSTKESPDV